MSNELALTFEATRVRVVIINDVPWWVLTDVCAVLEVNNAPQAASRLDDDEKCTICINDSAGGPERIMISEPGLYKLLQTSRKPQAKRFDRWIRHEVLPEIRKTGSYRGALPTLTEFGELLDTKLEPMHRGMADIRHEQGELRSEVAEVRGNLIILRDRVDDMAPRHKFTPNTKRMFCYVNHKRYNDQCALCRRITVITNGRQNELGHFDHFNGRERNRPQDGWLICVHCNRNLETDPALKDRARSHFKVYQDNLADLFGSHAKQSARKRSSTKTTRHSDQFKMNFD